MDYCDHCHGDGWRITNIGNKPIKCDECFGTGLATGAYESTPKVNGWNFWRVIEFIAAVIVLVGVGVIMTPSFLFSSYAIGFSSFSISREIKKADLSRCCI